MFNYLPFILVTGPNTRQKLTLMALSTCGFCRKAQVFLQDLGFEYQYIYLDVIDPALKAQAKEDYLNNFGSALSYPTLILDDKKVLVGFVRETWEENLSDKSL